MKYENKIISKFPLYITIKAYCSSKKKKSLLLYYIEEEGILKGTKPNMKWLNIQT